MYKIDLEALIYDRCLQRCNPGSRHQRAGKYLWAAARQARRQQTTMLIDILGAADVNKKFSGSSWRW